MSRQYSNAHHRERARLLPFAYDTACPLCGYVMLDGQDLDLDHSVARVLGGGDVGDRITHSHCNRSAGATLGNRLRGQKTAPATQAPATYDWSNGCPDSHQGQDCYTNGPINPHSRRW